MTTANRQERKQLCVLWKKESKNGKPYFTGKANINGYEQNVTAFYNLEKKNPKEPDLRIYAVDKENKLSKEPILSLWVNVSPAKNSKYLSGKVDGKRVVGFINESKANTKRPTISIYLSDDKKEEPAPNKQAPAQPQLDINMSGLPF